MNIEAHRWLMKAVGTPLERATFDAMPAPGEVAVAVAGCGVCHTDLGYYYDGVRTKHALPLALGHEVSGRVVACWRRCRGLGRQGGDRAGGAALRRMRSVPARPVHHLRAAEDARQRHPGRLCQPHRGAGARPVRGRRGPAGRCRPNAGAGVDRRRRADHPLPGSAARRVGTRQPGHRRRRRWRGRLLRAGGAGLRRSRGGHRRRRRQAGSGSRARRGAHLERPHARCQGPEGRGARLRKKGTVCAAPSGSSSNARAVPPGSSPRTACWCTAPRCRWSASRWTRSNCACPT